MFPLCPAGLRQVALDRIGRRGLPAVEPARLPLPDPGHGRLRWLSGHRL